MILPKEQINRYLRQIIMPEISGPGQKRLLESSVFVCGVTVNQMAPTVYYLAASGVGSIYCHFDDNDGFDSLRADIHDLNSHIIIELSNGGKGDCRVFLGRPEVILKKRAPALNRVVPTLISVYNGWQGGMAIFKDQDGLDSFLARLSAIDKQHIIPGMDSGSAVRDGEIFSTCFLGALSALEVIKLSLGIGETGDNFLYFDLFSKQFSRIEEAELEQTIDKLYAQEPADFPVQLQKSKVLIVGTGGLGSPAAYALTLGGIGTVGLVDHDVVEISNLNRQILHAASRLGMPKVESAAVFLKKINPGLNLNLYQTALSKKNVFDLIEGYDVVIAAVDNFPVRFLLNDACFLAGKPLIDAGVLRFDGTSMTIIPRQSSCYRCMLPDIPTQGNVPSCAESGVVGPLPGIFGFIQAAEAAKLLSGAENTADDKIIFFDGLSADFRTIKLSPRSTCPLCGTNPAIHELQDYEFQCRGGADGE